MIYAALTWCPLAAEGLLWVGVEALEIVAQP